MPRLTLAVGGQLQRLDEVGKAAWTALLGKIRCRWL